MTSKPHLLIVGSSSGHSGVPSYIRHLCMALRDRAEITVLSDGTGPGYAFVRLMGLRHLSMPGLSRRAGAKRLMQALPQLRAVVAGLAPDVVWGHSFWPIYLCRSMALSRPDWRLVTTIHGAPFGPGRRPGLSQVVMRYEETILKRLPCHDIVFVNNRDRARYTRLTGRQHRLSHVPNASDLAVTEPLLPVSGPPQLVMTSRLARQKDNSLAARIFAHLPSDWRLDLLGDGTDTPQARRMMARHLPPAALARIGFRGPRPQAGVCAALLGADAFLLTSRYEGMPIAALEAFECGLPVAMTDVGGSREILGAHPFGLKIDRADPRAAAAGLVDLVARARADRPGMMEQTRAAWAARFAPELWNSRMQVFFDTVLAEPRLSRC